MKRLLLAALLLSACDSSTTIQLNKVHLDTVRLYSNDGAFLGYRFYDDIYGNVCYQLNGISCLKDNRTRWENK